MPLVSVIIPTYGHQDYVLQTLDSVWAQTFKDYEVIVINDGSPDNTAELLRPLAGAGRITYIEQPNAGQAAARNRGLAEARGEYIAFLDDDDLWPPDTLEWQVAWLRSRLEAGVVCGTFLQFTGTTRPRAACRNAWKIVTLESCFESCPTASPGQALIRANSLRKVGGLDPCIWGADDFDLWMRLAALTEIHLCERVALYYRCHDRNASRDFERLLENRLKAIRKNIHLISRPGRGLVMQKALAKAYRGPGRRAVAVAKSRFVSGDLSVAFSHIRRLCIAFGVDLLRPRMCSLWLRDLVPLRLRRLV